MKGAWKGFFVTLGSEVLVAAMMAVGQKLAEALVNGPSAIPEQPKKHAKKARNKRTKKAQEVNVTPPIEEKK